MVRRPRRGFSLVELLVVIAIIAILIGLLLPAIQKVREAADRANASNNMKQLGVAALAHQDQWKYLPWNGNTTTTANVNDLANAPGTAGFQMLPFLEQNQLYAAMSAPVGSAGPTPTAANGLLVPIKVFLCPARGRPGTITGTDSANGGKTVAGPATDYAINSWINDPVAGSYTAANKRAKVQTIKDGASNTILFGEKSVALDMYNDQRGNPFFDESIFQGNYEGVARLGTTLLPDPDTEAAATYKNNWGGPFPNGVMFTFADGSVRLVSYSTPNGSTTSRFGYMIRPNDGVPVTFD